MEDAARMGTLKIAGKALNRMVDRGYPVRASPLVIAGEFNTICPHNSQEDFNNTCLYKPCVWESAIPYI
jgi:hypothetical protein